MKYKEFLNMKNGYTLEILPEHAGDDKDSGLIEVPEGAEFCAKSKDSPYVFFAKRSGDTLETFSSDHKNKWYRESTLSIDDIHVNYSIVWQRHTQPEELPFFDGDKPYSHYFKDVSNIDFIDVYRVLDLFSVEHPCIQHAVKKLLCAGQRGSKSRDKDTQEAIDSLQRFQEMRIEDGK